LVPNSAREDDTLLHTDEPMDAQPSSTSEAAATPCRARRPTWQMSSCRLVPSYERAAPRQRALACLRGLLSPAERKNSWQLAEVSGAVTRYGFQPSLGRARWDLDACAPRWSTTWWTVWGIQTWCGA
jgi:hypothetical protein